MSQPSHHGMHQQPGMNAMKHRNSLQHECIGSFGRMFNNLPPLYVPPSILTALGAQGGPMDGGKESTFTKTVPLGMVFLGQFIDHDVTLDTSSGFDRINDPSAIENFRTPTLDLDCVFGEGPEDEPFLYETDSNRLLTGASNQNTGQSTKLRIHDLPRNGQGIAMIGDARNDENRIISQLQLAFIRFYNAIYAAVEAQHPDYSPMEVYEVARRDTTWHYQWVLVNEFLPLFVGKDLVDDILGRGRQYYRPKHRPFIPVEFAVAAYRFGHSMVAQNVQLQRKGSIQDLFSRTVGRGFSPITTMDQVVEWEMFFDMNSSFAAQRAEKMDTKLASTLLDLPFIRSTNPGDRSLATRNLRRGQSFLLPSGESVAKFMGRPENEINFVLDRVHDNLADYDIELKGGVPLWFYILAEAEEIGRIDHDKNLPGEGLGPVGGRIVAEVLIGLLELDPRSYLGSNRDWEPHLSTLPGQFTMKDFLQKAEMAVIV